MHLHWRPTFAGTTTHIATTLARGKPLADPQMGASLLEPFASLHQCVLNSGVDPVAFWRQLMPLTCQESLNNKQIEAVLDAQASASSASTDGLTSIHKLCDAFQTAVAQAIPDITEDLAMRSGPLRQHWEARGPGMLAEVDRLTNSIPLETATVYLVMPVRGGGGEAHLHHQAVHLEAVLTNGREDLPEVARLAWLLSQLSTPVSPPQQDLSPGTDSRLTGLAMLIPTLLAAEHVELTRFNESVLQSALHHWLEYPPDPKDLIVKLLRWWDTYQRSSTTWQMALQALERTLVSFL